MRQDGPGRAGKSLLELLIALALVGFMAAMMLPAALQALKAAQALGS
ncbi:MAG: prepilin-type N-terminal cleavage/methylation domain-containing protein [Isosphaeraceae bacterium]